MNTSHNDPFCPRHGRASRRVEVPGLRCDCGQATSEPRSVSVSKIALDRTIELPSYVIEALAVRPNEYLYFVRDAHGFRLVTAAEMERSLGDDTVKGEPR